MSQHEKQNKERKKWRYVYRKFDIIQRFNIEDTKTPKQREKSDRLEWWKSKKLLMEKHYEGSKILFLEFRAHSLSLQICISFFTILVDLTFGKILNV